MRDYKKNQTQNHQWMTEQFAVVHQLHPCLQAQETCFVGLLFPFWRHVASEASPSPLGLSTASTKSSRKLYGWAPW